MIQRLRRDGLPSLAYCATPGRSPGVVFLGGFASDMTGTKAMALDAAMIARGQAFLRLDYRGHGQSEGRFVDGAVGDWLDDALAVFDAATQGSQILVGSSMGGWIGLLLALARPDRVCGFIGVAAAPDFTERLIWRDLDQANREHLLRDGVLIPPSRHGDPTPITLRLIEDGRGWLLLDRPIPFAGPVRLLHGQCDAEVPWRHALSTAEMLVTDDVRIILIKDGDHRLSRPQDLELLVETLDSMTNTVEGG
jgi:pimeloyl-ACP methyl ester carboxylesterase